MPNLREQIKALAKPKLVPCELGGLPVFLRRWNEKDQIEWAILCQSARGDDAQADLYIRCKALARSLCDEEGNRLYQDDEYLELAELDGEVIDPVWESVIELQRRDKEDAKKN